MVSWWIVTIFAVNVKKLWIKSPPPKGLICMDINKTSECCISVCVFHHVHARFIEVASWVHIHWTHIMSSHCNVAAAFPPQFHSPPQFHLNQAAILHKSHWFHICYAILVHENLIQYILKTDISPGWPSHFCWFARGYNVSAVTRVLSLNQKEICFKTGFNLAVSTKTPTVEIAEWGAHWSGTRDSFCGTECYLC